MAKTDPRVRKRLRLIEPIHVETRPLCSTLTPGAASILQRHSVGQTAQPQSQVEQITIALIYKFMDDMDAQAEALAASAASSPAASPASVGPLLAPEHGRAGHAESLRRSHRPDERRTRIPALFRDIFKNAYLPHRDPETLRAFLKEIDGFVTTTPERLGDAFGIPAPCSAARATPASSARRAT